MDEKRKRILYITADYPPRIGGQSRLSQYLVSHLRSCFDVTVFVQQDQVIDEPGVHCLKSHGRIYRRLTRRFYLLARAWEMSKTVGRNFDLVIAGECERSTFVAAYYTMFFARCPFVNLAHGRDFCWRTFTRPSSRIHRRLIQKSVLTISNSYATRERILERGLARNIEVVHPAVDLNRFHPSPGKKSGSDGNCPVILTVSRLVPRKGIERVLEALAGIDRDFLYLVVGSGPESAKLQTLSQTLGISSKVRWIEGVSDNDLPLYYQSCDFFVLTPYEIEDRGKLDYEGFGMVYLEANACGKPVIGTRSGGIPDAIADGVSGVLVEPGDKNQLREALIRFMSKPELTRKMADQALTWAKRFESAEVGHKYLSAIQKVLQ